MLIIRHIIIKLKVIKNKLKLKIKDVIIINKNKK
jgi:hypothetical protein